jgi:hypothetical protein
MPGHKQQHYVPRCYLKPFSIDEHGKAISLINIHRLQAIKCCPVKGQCAKSYFYGEDLELEKILRDIEGTYSTLLSRIVDGDAPSKNDLFFLRDFMFLQNRRTDMAVQRLRQMNMNLEQKVFEIENGHVNVLIPAIKRSLETL